MYYLTAFDEVKLIHSKTMCIVGNIFVNQLDINSFTCPTCWNLFSAEICNLFLHRNKDDYLV